MRKSSPKKAETSKKTKKERLSEALELPLDMLEDVPHFSLNDNRELTVENFKSIEGYEPSEILLMSKDYPIYICGENLSIIAITDEEILIRGHIFSMHLGVPPHHSGNTD